jgi:DNA-binding HxlR family transcriptional regulator
VEFSLSVIGDARRMLILWHLFWGARPYGELMRLLVGVSKKTLRHELVNLERSGLIRRVLREGGNRRAQYEMSEFGETLKPLLAALYQWGLSAQKRRSHAFSPTTARARALDAFTRTPNQKIESREERDEILE